MRILFIVPYAPSLIRVRPLQLIRSLGKRGNHLTLLTTYNGAEEREQLQELRSQSVEVFAFPLTPWRSFRNCCSGIFGRAPFQAVFSLHPKLTRKLTEVLSSEVFDVVHVEHLRGAGFGLQALAMLHSSSADRAWPAVVWDSVDCISHLFEQATAESKSVKGRFMTAIELRRTRRYEGWLVRQFDHVVVTSPIDREHLALLDDRFASPELPRVPISVIQNGVDFDYFFPTVEERQPATLVFTGKMSYHANVTSAVHLVRNIMPLVWTQRPDVKVLIVGKDPSREVRALEASSGGSVTVTGSVKDIRPYLRASTVAAVPLVYGAGIQNKVLEAMACATPVIASRKAVSALAAEPDTHLLVADGTADFAEKVLSLLSCPDLQRRLGRAGEEYVRNHHDWLDVAESLEETYRHARESRLSVGAHCPGNAG